jgi:replication factor C subunit 3/5
VKFLNHISVSENLNMSQHSLNCIQRLYKSDIRSMVNFMQSNQDLIKDNTDMCFNIIDDTVWSDLIQKISSKEKVTDVAAYVYDISTRYNVDKKNIIKDFINYIIRNRPDTVTQEFLNFVENIMHSKNSNNQVHVYHSLSRLATFL